MAPSHGISPQNFYHALQTFTSLPVPEEKATKVMIYDVVKLAKTLNEMDQSMRRKAEWIIRSNSPSVPYYMRSIDLANLSYSTIEALVSYFHIEL